MVVFVDGEAKVTEEDAETLEKLGALRTATAPFGLIVQVVPFRASEIPGSRRRAWASERISLDDVETFIANNPGITFLRLAEELFLGDQPLTAITFANAKAKARVAISRLHISGRVRKGYDHRREMMLWADGVIPDPGAIPGDVLLSVRKMVEEALREAARTKKTVSTVGLAELAARLAWDARRKLVDIARTVGDTG